MSILDQYTQHAPDPQRTVDLFSGTWSSQFPPELGVTTGESLVYPDARIAWANEQLGGFADKQILELGPLEAAQTYLLEQHGAANIVAIEANTTCYLKCLIAKELLNIQRSTFLFGDFLPYLRTLEQRFDVCIASGVLYHMRNPAELLALIARSSDAVFIWTHYYDWEYIKDKAHLVPRFGSGKQVSYAGFAYTQYHQKYQSSLNWAGFCGGSAPYSNWMSRDDILACLRYFGFDQITVSFEAPDHHGGPSFALAARRTDPARRPNFVLPPVADQPAAPATHNVQCISAADVQLLRTQREQHEQQLQHIQANTASLHAYVTQLEQTLADKQTHIADLEQHIGRLENGRVMRLLRRFG